MRTTKKFTTCDHPDCNATVEADDDLPEGWRPLSSIEHLTPEQKKRTQGYYLGCIYLELCPDHIDFFDAHLPQTVGKSYRSKDSTATVSCSCGAKLGWTYTQYILTGGSPGEPRHMPEARWWRHLPADLRAYNVQRDGELETSR